MQFSNKGKHSKKRGRKQTKIILTKVSQANNKSLVLHVHVIQHKAQGLTKTLLLKGQIACADASATTHTAGTNIPVAKIVCNTTPMQIIDTVEEVTWSDNNKKEEL